MFFRERYRVYRGVTDMHIFGKKKEEIVDAVHQIKNTKKIKIRRQNYTNST